MGVSMKVLITGVNGFIGRNIAQKFHSMGFEVVGIDIKLEVQNYKRYAVNLVEDDLTDLLKKENPDIMVHCAGLASVPYSVENPEEDFSANVTMVHRILYAIYRSGLGNRRFIMLSSAAVYGQAAQLPISEEAALNPMSPYALHKKMAEDICIYFVKNYHFNIRIARIFSAYGPGLRKQIFWDLFQKAENSGKLFLLGTGNESRDYIFIDDLAEAIYLLATDRKNNDILWNVANGAEIYIKDVARIFAAKRGISENLITFSGEIRECDPVNWCADISKIRQIGYEGRVHIEEGIEKYIKWAEKGKA